MPRISCTLINSNPQEISDEAWENICVELLDYIIALTPVDTGFMISNWEMDKESNDIFVIRNETPYASFLEDGWSQQAPKGMLQPALERLPTIIRRNIGRRRLRGEVTATIEIPDYIPGVN